MFGFIRRLFGPPTDFKKLVATGAIIVDVRTTEEYKSGHLKGSVNIPLNHLKQEIDKLNRKSKPVITVCRSGARSGVAKSMLKDAGIEAFNGGPWNNLEQKLLR